MTLFLLGFAFAGTLAGCFLLGLALADAEAEALADDWKDEP